VTRRTAVAQYAAAMNRAISSAIALVLFAASPAASALEDVPVYGTISVSRVSHPPDKIVDIKKEGGGMSGQEVTSETRTWSITVRYLPQKKKSARVVYRRRLVRDSKQDGMSTCQSNRTQYQVADHDYEIASTTDFAAGTKDSDGSLSLFVESDGSYKIQVPDVSVPAPKGEVSLRMRDMVFGCRPDQATFTRTSSSSSASIGSMYGDVKAKAEKMPADVFASKEPVPVAQPDGSVAMVSWNLTRAMPKAVARITAPATFHRGDSVTLDGKRSEGKISEYRWHFDVDPQTCNGSAVNASQEWTGAELTFKALCDFTAHLEVKDESGFKARDEAMVSVEARDGPPWTTHFTKPVEALMTGVKITTVAQAIGMNRCAYKSHGVSSTEADHIIHSRSKNSTTWFDDGYLIAEVADAGPFKGMHYVRIQMLDIARVEKVNVDLLPAPVVATLNAETLKKDPKTKPEDLLAPGTFMTLNAAKKNSAATDLLLAQARAHEAMHSTLMKEAFDRLGDDDPALAVERVTGASQDAVQTLADMKIRGAQTVMHEASLDAKVQERLHAMSAFSKDVDVWLPAPQDGGDERKVNLGPAWAIGD
jgi:hypothetical protein